MNWCLQFSLHVCKNQYKNCLNVVDTGIFSLEFLFKAQEYMYVRLDLDRWVWSDVVMSTSEPTRELHWLRTAIIRKNKCLH